jgi:hypothetical protein
VTDREGGQVNDLVQKHLLKMIPSSLLSGGPEGKPGNNGFFQAVFIGHMTAYETGGIL